jgi:hypothetical protein
MEFNPDKCEVLMITKKRNPVIFPYTLHNIQLNSTLEAKYVGVTLLVKTFHRPKMLITLHLKQITNLDC